MSPRKTRPSQSLSNFRQTNDKNQCENQIIQTDTDAEYGNKFQNDCSVCNVQQKLDKFLELSSTPSNNTSYPLFNFKTYPSLQSSRNGSQTNQKTNTSQSSSIVPKVKRCKGGYRKPKPLRGILKSKKRPKWSKCAKNVPIPKVLKSQLKVKGPFGMIKPPGSQNNEAKPLPGIETQAEVCILIVLIHLRRVALPLLSLLKTHFKSLKF